MTLQEHYNLIKEGKGSKTQFLSEAKRNHKDAVSNINTFDQAVDILKSKAIINEHTFYADLKPITTFQPSNREPFENKFADFLAEQSKRDKDEAVKIEAKKESEHVKEVGDHNYDYADPKNVNNQIGQEVLNGIYCEVQKDPQITQEAAMKEVMKNLSKDKLYYVKEGQFGVEGLGYTEQKQEEVSGKHKSSGYSDKLKAMVKESLSADAKFGNVVTSGHKDSVASKSNEIIMQMMNEMEDKIEGIEEFSTNGGDPFADKEELEMGDQVDMGDYIPGIDDGEGPMDSEEMDVTIVPLGEEDEDYAEEESDDMRTMEEEAIVDEEPAVKIPKKKDKKMTLQKRMSEIEKLGTSLALEAKMEAIDEEIQERNDQLSMLDENEAMKKLMDPKKMKELQKEIKLLEKKRGQYEKMHAKASKDSKKKDE